MTRAGAEWGSSSTESSRVRSGYINVLTIAGISQSRR